MNSLHRPQRHAILTVFGTRPEMIKLAPVLRQLEQDSGRFRTINVSSGQHTDLLSPFVKLFGVRVDHDLKVMRPGQPLNLLFGRVLAALDPLLEAERPDLVLVQGDTTTATAAALAAFHRQIPVGHVEAGLRTEDPLNPFPEETNRRIVSRLATYHFAATERNYRTLLNEGIPEKNAFLTGNPVVDALQFIREKAEKSARLSELLRKTEGTKRIALTTHRRESFGDVMEGNLKVLRHFIETHPDATLIFPVHPNPQVTENAHRLLGENARILLTEPLDYPDFIGLLSESWIIVSDSGGVQEESPSLGKKLLVLRETTERPEAVESGVAQLARTPTLLGEMLETAYRENPVGEPRPIENPFGRGDSGSRIARAIRQVLCGDSSLESAAGLVQPAGVPR
jgi:UDP-N-acetylglucosamine 2-epimerase (non-hydrolysing)